MNVPTPGRANSGDFPPSETFRVNPCSGCRKKLAAGVDLSENEVKSAYLGGSYEYQYHKNTGKEKLKRDAEVGHLFFDHRDNLRHVDLRYAHGSSMKDFFRKWLQEFPDPYGQRYRKNIPFNWVKENAILLMTIEDGEITYPQTAVAPKAKDIIT